MLRGRREDALDIRPDAGGPADRRLDRLSRGFLLLLPAHDLAGQGRIDGIDLEPQIGRGEAGTTDMCSVQSAMHESRVGGASQTLPDLALSHCPKTRFL